MEIVKKNQSIMSKPLMRSAVHTGNILDSESEQATNLEQRIFGLLVKGARNLLFCLAKKSLGQMQAVPSR